MITNTAKPTTTLANASKVSIGETWATITTSWTTETRSWLAVSQLFVNIPKVTQSYLWSIDSFPWLNLSPWDTVFGGIINTSKPA